MVILSPEAEQRAREALLPERRAALVRYMTDRQFGRAEAAANGAGRAAAAALGWVEPGSGEFTEIGRLAADSCREYRFWVERDRRLPFETGGSSLGAAQFAGRTVFEIGCGMGVNLMSLAGVAGRLSGVEPIAIYRQLGAIFREAEGLSPIEVHDGSGEAIPAADNAADVVLCVTAHQYMDVRAALVEMARILRPGGELVLIGGTLGAYLRGCSPTRFRADAITVVNTLGYMATGRRPFPARGPSTSRPIYPTAVRMTRLLKRAGFALDGAPIRLGTETCFVARKAG